jgi:acyl-CoA thioester hydrolase
MNCNLLLFGDEGIRTPGLCRAKAALSQLSYIPVRCQKTNRPSTATLIILFSRRFSIRPQQYTRCVIIRNSVFFAGGQGGIKTQRLPTVDSDKIRRVPLYVVFAAVFIKSRYRKLRKYTVSCSGFGKPNIFVATGQPAPHEYIIHVEAMNLQRGRAMRNECRNIELSMDKNDFKFFLPVRVHYADTDAMQVVYYGAYSGFFEASRQEYWRRMGIKLNDVRDKGYHLTIAEIVARYLKPAHYDDVLDIYVRTARLGNSSFDLDYLSVRRKDDVISAVGRTTFVVVNRDEWTASPIPDWLRAAIDQFENQK